MNHWSQLTLTRRGLRGLVELFRPPQHIAHVVTLDVVHLYVVTRVREGNSELGRLILGDRVSLVD